MNHVSDVSDASDAVFRHTATVQAICMLGGIPIVGQNTGYGCHETPHRAPCAGFVTLY